MPTASSQHSKQPSLAPPPCPKRLLITRLSAHGDVVQTLPLAGLIKTHYPETHIGWVVEAAAAPLLEDHPWIDKLHVSHRKDWVKQAKKGEVFSSWQALQQFLKDIRAQHYTHSVDVQGLLKSALLPWLAGIPHRWGYKHTREFGDWFYTHTLPPHRLNDPNTPTLDWFTRFVEPLYGIHRIPYLTNTLPWPYTLAPASQTEVETVNHWLSELDSISESPLIVLAPGTAWQSKQWPIYFWQDLIQILANGRWRVVLIGNTAEHELCERILAHYGNPLAGTGCLNLAGKTSFKHLQALMREAHAMIGPDSLALHMAHAVAASHHGKPHVLGLFGPTAPARTGPIGESHATVIAHVPCQPCFKRHCPLHDIHYQQCMTTLSPDNVIAQLAAWFPNFTPSGRPI